MKSDLDQEFSPNSPPRGHFSNLVPKGAKRSPRVPKGCQKALKGLKTEPKGYQNHMKIDKFRLEMMPKLYIKFRRCLFGLCCVLDSETSIPRFEIWSWTPLRRRFAMLPKLYSKVRRCLFCLFAVCWRRKLRYHGSVQSDGVVISLSLILTQS